MVFPPPQVSDFFDNRLLVSWKISQPENHPPLQDIHFTIVGKPELVFEPNQRSTIEIPALDGNEVILNWVFIKPTVITEISLTIIASTIEETQKILVTP